MDPFEYVVMLPSLILGLGIAQILTNVADIFSNLKNIKTSLCHSLLIFVVFMTFIQDWWYFYQYSQQIVIWRFAIVLFLLIYPILLLLLSRMLFPTGWRGHETDLDKYYFDQWPWFFFIYTLTVIASIIQNVFISGFAITEQYVQLFYLFWLLIFQIFRVRERWAHNAFLILQTLVWIGFMIVDTTVLENNP